MTKTPEILKNFKIWAIHLNIFKKYVIIWLEIYKYEVIYRKNSYNVKKQFGIYNILNLNLCRFGGGMED